MLEQADLHFDAEFHEYRVGGQRWPSVTDVLQPLQELDGIPRATLEAARVFGDHVHRACHLFNVGQLDEGALDPHLVPYLNAWRKLLNETGATVVASERRVVHRKLRYAGTLDAAVTMRKKRYLVDIKATATVPRTVGPQTAAYREAYAQERLLLQPKRFCAHLRADGTYRLVELNDPRDWSIFLSALNLWNWRNGNVR